MANGPSKLIPRQVIALPPESKPKTADILAAEKIIADISSGIYRSPAAALKELVSNAYDADAKTVTITTDTPHFRNLVIEDNGLGMSIDKFIQVITHVGGSRKRIESDRSPSLHRKLIGRIGIGLMSVAQLGNRFYVSSSVKGEATRFIAEVNLEPFHRDDAALRSMGKIEKDGKVHIGAVKYIDNIPEMKHAQYTVITVPDAKKGLISEMTSSVRKAVGAHERLSIEDEKRQIKTFAELIEVVRTAKRADLALDGYYYMLWELALLCPINYSKAGPFEHTKTTNGSSIRRIEGVDAFEKPKVKDFRVYVDGLELERPQLFPNAGATDYPSPNPKVYLLDFDRKIAKRRLHFSGYIYSQQPRIDPEELKGVQIRIRHVGIGKYDKSWLGYPFEEGLKFGQITGEVFVDEGLEPALNIDRDSFRETDVHYQALRAYIWHLLHDEVFPDFKARQKVYKDQKKTKERTTHGEKFRQAILQLPAPLTDRVELVKGPDNGSFLVVTSTKLKLNKAKWEAVAAEVELTGKDAQDRFFRVLTVLASNEMLQELTEEELDTLIRALAVAIQ